MAHPPKGQPEKPHFPPKVPLSINRVRTSRMSGSTTKAARRLMEQEAENSHSQYPHHLHPGLVPGISVDEQRNSFGIDRLVFFLTAGLILAFIVWGVVNPAGVSAVAATSFAWAMRNAAWLFNIVMILGIVLMTVLAFSRFGNIRLGTDDEEPEFSRFSWIAMMFAAGIGVGIFFFGPSEPLSHFLTPPPETVEAGTPQAIHMAMAQSHFHWGISAWALYAMVGGALAYSSYRRGRVSLFSSVFRSLFGSSATEGVPGRLVDMMAIIATLFGTAATLGISTLQIGQGVQLVAGIGPLGNNVLLIIMAVLTVGFVLSAVSGVSKGVRYLSNVNIVLTLGAVAFVFLLGPTLFMLNLLPSGILTYFSELLNMMGKSLSWGEETVQFQSEWTSFYWAWWISWTPFVGMFIARISRGRSLREFVLVTMTIPPFILAVAFTVFGGTTITLSQAGIPGFDGSSGPQEVLFHMFETLPLSSITPFVLMFILAVFFITSADSASVVMGTLSSKGNPAPSKPIVVFWGVAMMGIAVVMLLSGGEDALSGLQSLTILIALPFSVVLLVMMVSFVKDLSTDPAAIRRTYAKAAIENAVVTGLEKHGDDFELAVQRSEEGKGAGADFDSTAEKVTEWYQRTDEEGNEVEYDYASGEWGDGYEPEEAEENKKPAAAPEDEEQT